MSHTLTLTSFGEKWHFKTAHHIDMNIGQVFEDLLSFRNFFHWDEMDLENFLAVKGRIVFECIPQLQSDNNDIIPAVLASEKFKNIKEIIVCVYSHSIMALDDYRKIIDQVSAAVSAKTTILAGLICDEQTDQRGVAVNLIALCTE
jgi:hypothetical protein